jgi:bifunctional aspartokinase / homoserine dehydrogenase 1
MKVLKFGGSSVATEQRIRSVSTILADTITSDIESPIVVVSACGDTTDHLLAIAEASLTDLASAELLLAELIKSHEQLASALVSEEPLKEYCSMLAESAEQLVGVVKGISLLGELTPRCKDFIVSFGEQWSAQLLASFLPTQNIPAYYIDARQLIVACPPYGAGKVVEPLTHATIREKVTDRSRVAVITGYIASSPDGASITLGRGGSDYTAAIVSAALKADELQIWTDVNGMMTADPRKVPSAFTQPSVSYAEAMELCHFGAYVVYPPTVQPAMSHQIPIRIKNTLHPNQSGTIISANKLTSEHPLTGITSIPQVTLMRLQGNGIIGVEGTAARVFKALAEAEINIILITQASSEHTICFAIRPEVRAQAEEALRDEFSLEMHHGLIEAPVSEAGMSIVSVVGDGMRHVPGIAGKVFNSLGRNGVNLIAIAQGSSERNISFVIPARDEVKALQVVHEEFFFPDRKTSYLYLIGTGLIGTAFMRQLREQAELLAEQRGHSVVVLGVSNTKQMIIGDQALRIDSLSERLEEAKEPANLSGFIASAIAANVPNKIFVDCTASAEVAEQYATLLRHSISVVTPNKKAQSASLESYQHLKTAASKRHSSFLYETSVGAGLPVIGVLKDLIQSGDEIISIQGILSGTLSYLFNSFNEDCNFSELVKMAQEKGFTEPDPRDDLNGMDVARKILILARECNAQLELKDVEVESLIPGNCINTQNLSEFYEELELHDHRALARFQQAKQEGQVLRYIAEYSHGKAKVSLQTVGKEHPFYSLSGSDNIVAFTSRRYFDRPLVVKGPGAGAEVTAAGVLADVLRLSH